MGFWDKLKGELIDIIKWLDDSNDTMVYRFERYGNEIKWGAKLVVREGQAAVFVNQGQIADVFDPGIYTLNTKNLPILSTLLGWHHGFESPWKAECYFVSTRRFTDLKWGTKNPIMLRDAEFGPIRLRAFGTYTLQVTDPPPFIRQIVGTDGHFTTDEVTDQLRNEIVSRFADILGESKIPALDLASNYDELGEFISERIKDSFKEYGLTVHRLLVENISLPEAVEKALDDRASMGVIGNMQQYTQFKSAEAIKDAAQNPSGGAGMGMGLGAGFAMGGQMASAMGASAANAAPAPPPPPPATQFYISENGQQTGPLTPDSMRQLAAAGRLKADTYVWQPGMAGWEKAGAVAAVVPFLSQAPPPPPPPGPGAPPAPGE